MTGRERMLAALAFREPDRIPHFEEMFELNPEAFRRDFPSEEAIAVATGNERERLLHACVELYAAIVERFGWDAVCLWRPWGGPQQLDCLRMLQAALGDRVLVGGFIACSIHAIDTITDYEAFSVDLYEHPEVLHTQALAMSDAAITMGRAMRDAGADFVNLVSDVAYNSGPFLAPRHFREFVTPYMHRHIPALKAEGLYVIQHSDGNLMPILDDWIAPGMHALHSLDPMAGMDIAEVKRRTYGQVALMGNVQCNLLQDGPLEAIGASARYCLEHASPGGGYIFSTSNTIFPGMPLAHYAYMLDVHRAFCDAREKERV